MNISGLARRGVTSTDIKRSCANKQKRCTRIRTLFISPFFMAEEDWKERKKGEVRMTMRVYRKSAMVVILAKVIWKTWEHRCNCGETRDTCSNPNIVRTEKGLLPTSNIKDRIHLSSLPCQFFSIAGEKNSLEPNNLIGLSSLTTLLGVLTLFI